MAKAKPYDVHPGIRMVQEWIRTLKSKTGRTLDYVKAGDENRKVCGLYLSLMDRMGIKLDRFGDADTRLEGL